MSKNKKRRKKTKQTDNVSNVISSVEAVANTDYVKSKEIFYREFQYVLSRLRDQSFRLVVLGEFSSGKSTFLNALMEKDILKHGAVETTAAITEIRNDPKAGDRILFDVYYVDGKEEHDIPIDQLTEYTATSSQKHKVAQEIDKVVIRTHVLDAGNSVSFIDTPGLNGTADLHREKTLEQVKSAHACIYLMQVRGLGKTDIDFLKYIMRYQHNIIFVQNFIDELKELEGDTPEEKINKQRALIEAELLKEDNHLSYEIVAVSARKALIARDENFREYDGEILTDSIRQKLYAESRFEDVVQEVVKLMQDNEKGKLQRMSAMRSALELMEYLYEVVSVKNEREMTEWDHSAEAQQLQKYKRIREELLNSREAYYRNICNYIKMESDDIRKNLDNRIDCDMRDLEDYIDVFLSDIKTVEEMDEYLGGCQLPQDLYQRIEECEEKCNHEMTLGFNYLITAALMRIEEYTGQKADSVELPEMQNITGQEERVEHFEQEENVISRLQKKTASLKTALEKERSMKRKIGQSMEENRAKDEATVEKQQQNERQKQKKLQQLGEMPELEEKYRTETRYEYRGGFGILDALFGPKAVRKKVPYMDDSRQLQWKKQKVKIEQNYTEEKLNLDKEHRDLQMILETCEEQLEESKRKEKRLESDIQQMKDLLESRQRELDTKREKAMKEYLQNLRKQTKDAVHIYLEEVMDVLKERFQKVIELNEEGVTETIRELFELSFNERIESLDALINEDRQNPQNRATEDLKDMIEKSIKVLEDEINGKNS